MSPARVLLFDRLERRPNAGQLRGVLPSARMPEHMAPKVDAKTREASARLMDETIATWIEDED